MVLLGLNWRSKVKDCKRALRRHHVARLKKSRRWYYGTDLWQSAKDIGRATHTPQQCSCWMCGNQRKHFGVSIQELRWPACHNDD
ncbi:MAG: hypothetical protein D3M94_12810 [Rhodocyclales bacterium GT-UBC]|nr:MAG: hypothetical protein D3M94_12810 [Rhodocyclales bacterium GT-UBC]